MPADIDNLFTPQQATALLRKSRCQGWRYGRDGTLRSVVLAGKQFNPLQGSDQGPQLPPNLGANLPRPPIQRASALSIRLSLNKTMKGSIVAQEADEWSVDNSSSAYYSVTVIRSDFL